jgi:hypothetical protein
MPLRDMEIRRQYKHQITGSQAIVTAIQVLKETLGIRDGMPEDVKSIMEADVSSYMLKKIKWPLQIIELLICNQENAILALEQTNLIASINGILELYGKPDQEFTAEVAFLIKTAARILATVMNQIQARTQFLEGSIKPLANLMTLMAANKVFD